MPRLPAPDPRSIPDDVAQFPGHPAPGPDVHHPGARGHHDRNRSWAWPTPSTRRWSCRSAPGKLAILTLAEETGSTFVWTQHVPISETAGVTSETRQLIRDRDYRNPALPGPDSTILHFTPPRPLPARTSPTSCSPPYAPSCPNGSSSRSCRSSAITGPSAACQLSSTCTPPSSTPTNTALAGPSANSNKRSCLRRARGRAARAARGLLYRPRRC